MLNTELRQAQKKKNEKKEANSELPGSRMQIESNCNDHLH